MSTIAHLRIKVTLLIVAITIMTAASKQMRADTGTCGGQSITIPFTDVPSSSIFFCAIAEAYFLGLTNGTTATTYSPTDAVPREQMAAFVTRTLDQSVKRSSRRLAMRQTWTPQTVNQLGMTTVGTGPTLVEADGADLWVANGLSNTVSRVRASDGRLLETWTGAVSARGVLIAMGKVFVCGQTTPGRLYEIDPTQTAGAVTTLSTSLGTTPDAIAFDGQKIWTANENSVSIIDLTTNPPSVTTVTNGFVGLIGIIYDGSSMWVTDAVDNKLKKLNPDGSIALSVSVGTQPYLPAFDGTNLWVPNIVSNSISVVRASTGTVVATLTGNGLNMPAQAAFDGERILVVNQSNSISVWKATDLTPIVTFSTGSNTFPFGACSDGVNFWVTLNKANKLLRF